MFSNLLLAYSLLQIMLIYVDSYSIKRDHFGWLDGIGDSFLVTSAYELGAREGDVGKGVVWRQLWKIKSQQRVRYFLWVLAHDKLLTNYGRWRRRLADNLDCQPCSGQREEALYAIRDCPSAREIWDLILPQQLRRDFFLWDPK